MSTTNFKKTATARMAPNLRTIAGGFEHNSYISDADSDGPPIWSPK
jgi:hypothetical protein